MFSSRHVCENIRITGGSRSRQLARSVGGTESTAQKFLGYKRVYAAFLATSRNDSALQFASAAAALKVATGGGRGGSPTRGDVDEFLQQRSLEGQA